MAYVPGSAKLDWDARFDRDELLAIYYDYQQRVGSYSVYPDGPHLADDKRSVHANDPARIRLETPASLPHDHWQKLRPFPQQGAIRACAELARTSEPPHPSLIAKLGEAIGERDWLGARYAWHLLKGYTHKTSLNLHSLAISTELIHFLLFRAQLPDLFCAIVHQSTLANWRRGLDGHAFHHADKGEIVPIVAALMEAVHYVRRGREGSSFAEDVERHKKKREGWEGHDFQPGGSLWWRSEASSPRGHGNDTWWHRALTVLVSALPRKPRMVARFHSEASEHCTVSLLERAVLCSELSTVMLEHLLGHCAFRQRQVVEALDAALHVTNVRGTTRPRLAGLLYAELWRLRPTPSPSPALRNTASLRFLQRAWAELVLVGPTQRVVQLHTTAERDLVVPVHGDPSEYEAVMASFLEVHDHDVAPERVAGDDKWVLMHLCCHAMEVAVAMESAPTYLVKHLVSLADANNFLGQYFELPAFLSTLVAEHPTAWTPALKAAFRAHPAKERQDALVVEAMELCLRHHLRDGVDLILDAVVRLPDALKTQRALGRFLGCLCRPWPATKNQFGMVASRDEVRAIWEVLRTYLACGGDASEWDPEVLQSGLAEASRIRSGVAVEALVSKPYSVTPPADDAFSLAVLEAVLAPGGVEARAAGERFGKRQRGEAAGQEG